MPRYYTEISKEDFIAKVEKMIIGNDDDDNDFPWEMPIQLANDLIKVQFDWENYTTPGEYQRPYANYPFVGYKELKPGFHVYFMQAGGDWEYPICFIFYWGEGKLRAYIPTDGNAWNKKEKCAYGSEENPKGMSDDDYETIEKEINGDLMIADILKRITTKS